MDDRGRQGGLSLVGFIMVAAVIAIFVVVGARVTPAYIEYFSVQKSLEKTLAEAKDPTSQVDVRRTFERYLATDYIDSISARDLEISKDGNQITASVSWARKLHLVGNLSLFLDFEASATR
jgi:hypothetical protein